LNNDGEESMIKLQKVVAAAGAVATLACAQAQTTSDSDVLAPQGGVIVTGRVVDSNGNPIPGARVYIANAGIATRTDANGNYTLTGAPDGPQVVVVRKPGFAPTRADAKFSTKASDRDRNNVNVTLLTRPQAVSLATEQSQDSSALARLGFIDREQRYARNAYFLTPADIQSTRAVTLSDLFRQVPVIVTSPGPTGSTVLRGANGCLATYVDGVRWRSMFAGDLETYVPASDVIAAEVYPPGALPPPPFNQSPSRSNCTTLALWTRSAVS
jgi:hypothetical protein